MSIRQYTSWGDNSQNGKRPIYTLAQINGGILGDGIVFNSISDSVIGNEVNFVGSCKDDGSRRGVKNKWDCRFIWAEDQQEYIIRCYVHNNNPNGLSATAKDVKVGFYTKL